MAHSLDLSHPNRFIVAGGITKTVVVSQFVTECLSWIDVVIIIGTEAFFVCEKHSIL